jgi:hypothetical protein
MGHKLLYTLIFFFASGTCQSQNFFPVYATENLYKFSKTYFRSDPLASEFSVFMKHLLNDPTIKDKFVQQKTDSTLYAFYGVYTNYNPFFFTPKRVEVLLEQQVIEYGDSTKQLKDTIFSYQLMAFTDDNAAGEADIKKEFDKIHRQTNRKFTGSNYNEIKNGDLVKTAIHNYFVPAITLAPVSLMRGRLNEKKEWVLNISLRFKVRENQAILPILNGAYGPK